MIIKSSVLILFIFIGLKSVSAQFVLKGRVTNEAGQPLAGANVANARGKMMNSDSTGYFQMDSDNASDRLTFSYVGYNALTALVQSGEAAQIKLKYNLLLLEATVVTAFGQNANIQRAPVAVSILNKYQLERYSNASLVPAINTVPGVKMDERSPGSYRLNIRGNLLRSTFGVRNVKIYWNGIPFSDANGNAYMQHISLNDIDKVEIIKGPSGSMYGAGTGGVVLLSAFPGEVNEKYLKLQSITGSYGLFSISGAYKIRNESSGTNFSFSHLGSDGYRHHSNLRREVANYSSVFKISDKQDVNVSASYSDLYYQTPGGLTFAEQTTNPKQSRPAAGLSKSAAEQQAALYIKTLFAGVSHNYAFNKNLNNSTSLVVNHTRFKNPAIRNYERKTEQGVSLRSLTRFNKGIFSSILGGEYQYSFNNTATYGNRRGLADTLQYHDELGSRQFNMFLQASIVLSKFNVTAGLSYNNFHYSFLRISEPGSLRQASNFKQQYVPRIAVGYTASDLINLYASVSKGYSPPSVDEVHASDGIFNRDLRAEFALNYEAGIKAQAIPGKLYTEVIVYHFGLRNTIVSRRDATGGEFYVNAGKTKQTGLEISANYLVFNEAGKLFNRLNFWGSATIVRAHFDEYQQGTNKFDGNKLTGTPANVFVFGADLNVVRFYSNLSYSYTGRIPLNDANAFFADRYTMLTTKLGYRGSQQKKIAPEFFAAFEKTFNVPFSLGNDLNATGNRFYNPSAPQTFTLGASFRLNLRKDGNKLNSM